MLPKTATARNGLIMSPRF